ncbi:MAG: hypothetical protein J7M21_01230, partial [Planctomycetes bacterium]|nr:hypothetical protein [Planctomycetota bacterium]
MGLLSAIKGAITAVVEFVEDLVSKLFKSSEEAEKDFSKTTEAGSAKQECPLKKKKLIEIKWQEQQAWCSETVHVTGRTENYQDNEKITITVKNAADGKEIKTLEASVVGQSFSAPWEIVDVLPAKSGGHYQEEMNLDAYAEDKKTPKPLKLRFVPNVPKRDVTSRWGEFYVKAEDYQATIGSDIKYIKGWAASVVKLGAHAPAGTGGLLDGKLAWNGYRWMKQVGTGHKFWDGSAWQDLPAGFVLSDANNFCVGFYKNGTKYTCQYGGD